MIKKYFTEEEKKAARKIEAKKYYDKIKKKPISEGEKARVKAEREKKREDYIKNYYLENKEKICDYAKEYWKSNKIIKQKKNNERYKKRRDEDPLFKLMTNIKRNIRTAIKKNGLTKNSSTITILGCSYVEFKAHLESLFEDWMAWENYGKYNGELNHGWDIDHITPISSAKTEEDVIRLNHYSNLRPLCSYTNRCVKKDNIITVNKVGNISALSIK